MAGGGRGAGGRRGVAEQRGGGEERRQGTEYKYLLSPLYRVPRRTLQGGGGSFSQD